MQDLRLSIDIRRLVHALFFIVGILLLASFSGQLIRFELGYDSVKGLVQLFHVNQEQNLPTFFSVALALFNALLALLIADASRRAGQTDARYWFAIAAGFFFLAFDEAFQVHERMTAPTQAILGTEDLGIFYFSWVIPGILGVCVLGLVFMRFLLRQPSRTRHACVLAAGIYFGGCLGMEMLSGAYMEARGIGLVHSFLTTVEEGLEMSGLIWFIKAFLENIAERSAAARPAAPLEQFRDFSLPGSGREAA